MAAEGLRLDKWLWFARVVKKREWAHAMAESGRLRIDGRPVERAATPVRVGQVLSFATPGGRVRAIRVLMLPDRRGSPAEGLACYRDLLASGPGDDTDGDAQALTPSPDRS